MHGPIQKPTHLGLIIAEHKCIGCGNKWISSHACLTNERFGIVGSSRLNPEEERLPFSGFRKWGDIVHHPGCFRCVPLQLGVGWQRPPITAPTVPTEPNRPAQPKEDKDVLDI